MTSPSADSNDSILVFEPVYQTRVWGGRTLESEFGRTLPNDHEPFGESWEISAREEADSVCQSGPYAGKRLTELWGNLKSRREIFGEDAPDSDRFPLLMKILDARDRLSIQVHPPLEATKVTGGEPKTEMWFIADADPGAELYVGLKEGVSKADFENALNSGTTENCVHRMPVKAGDHIFIESGRLHAIGAGILIYEIQQNSDTTFRVFDWNRMGLDGTPRQLHIGDSLACIDFEDVEPTLDQANGNVLATCEHFSVERHGVSSGSELNAAVNQRFAIGTVISGSIQGISKGGFFIIPAGAELSADVSETTELLLTVWGTTTA